MTWPGSWEETKKKKKIMMMKKDNKKIKRVTKATDAWS